MAVDFQFLNRANITVSNVVEAIVTNASGATTLITGIYAYNSHGSAVTLTVYIVPNAAGSVGTAATGNTVFVQSLAAGEEYPINDIPILLDGTNDTLQMVASVANVVNVFCMGVIQT